MGPKYINVVNELKFPGKVECYVVKDPKGP